MKYGAAVSVFMVLGACVLSSARADTLVLKSGQTVEGEIVEKNDRFLKIRTEGVVLPYWFSDISEINGAAADPAAVTPASDAAAPEAPAAPAPDVTAAPGQENGECAELDAQAMKHFDSGNYAQAALSWESLAERCPDLPLGAAERLAYCYYAAKDFAKAEALLQQRISAGKVTPLTYASLGIVFKAQGKLNEAQEMFRKYAALGKEKSPNKRELFRMMLEEKIFE